MGKRYFCDFCQKSIPRDIENRKKHNEGVAHLNNRAIYYSKYKDLATTLLEEREKKPCQKYFSSGYCAFGQLCRNSHRTPSELGQLESLYRIECHNKAKEYEEKIKEQKEIQQKRKKASSCPDSLITDFLSKQAEAQLEKFLPQYELPGTLKAVDPSMLPASLRPPSFRDLINFPFSEFG